MTRATITAPVQDFDIGVSCMECGTDLKTKVCERGPSHRSEQWIEVKPCPTCLGAANKEAEDIADQLAVAEQTIGERDREIAQLESRDESP